MEAILPFKIKNEQAFFDGTFKVGFDEMEIYKFIYIMQLSDLDIFPKMHDERINMLIYGWEICEDYKQKLNPNEWELPEEMEIVLKLLVPWSMDIWFSKEWDKCKYLLKSVLIHCLNRARDLLMRMPDMMQINWDFLLLYNLKPWNVLYLKNLNVTKEKTLENGAQSIETEELPATEEDISYVKLEQLPIIVLRLVKLFDQSSIDMVKTLCMRVIAAWNKIHQTELETSGSRRPYIPPEDKRCLMLICHIYLMAVYESDDVKGYVIDNMINNIRFYYQGFQNSTPLHIMDNLEYTPARYIALTNIHLRVQKRDFFDFFIWNKYDTALVNLFGVVSQAYKSYLLGNLLMELNNMNEDDFASNIPLYKRLMNSYVNEREKSELFVINELNKIEAQRYANNIIQSVKNVTDFKSKICKGNRMSNIGNYENSDDTVAPLAEIEGETKNSEEKICEIEKNVLGEEMEDEQERVRIKESELRLDPIFQNLPNNESILYYVYDVLAKKDYTGWHFAKIVLLVKIIGREQNMIETWRYHPGLTTDFMLNLEKQLSQHYVDLAKIFKDHPFLEQEFWLTAFYLNPTSELYETIKRLGMRNNRKRTDEQTKLVMSIDNIEAKYGLLSSTIDVKDLAFMSNTDDPATDYGPLFSALHSLRVPDSLVKDMLTAIFLPRNRSFAWSVDWVVLRNRCKMIMTSSKEKKRFVDLNMAEANERLKYLIIDYEKYKNRPQLDYGTIEEGYENLMSVGEFDKESEEEEEEEEDFEDDEDLYENKRRGRATLTATARKKEDEKIEEENSQEDDPFLMGKRRTRARTAATLASFLFQTLPRSTRRRRNQKAQEDEMKADKEKIAADNDDKSSDSKSPITTPQSPISSALNASCDQTDAETVSVPTETLKECLKKRPTYLNTTHGFQNLIDIWNVEKSDLQSIDENCVSLMESSAAIQIAVKLKLLNKEINPLGCDEKEYIDDMEMIIHNAEFAIKKECDLNAIKTKEISDAKDERTHFVEAAVASNLDNDKEYVIKLETAETNHIQERPPPEENSRESTNSDMSSVAQKDSGETSEANTEINSRHNSVNIDTEMDNKSTQNGDSNVESITGAEQIMAAVNEKRKYQEIEEISENALEGKEERMKLNRIKEKSSCDSDIKILQEPQDLDNENELNKSEMRQIKDNNVSETKELITGKSLNEELVIQDTMKKHLEKQAITNKESEILKETVGTSSNETNELDKNSLESLVEEDRNEAKKTENMENPDNKTKTSSTTLENDSATVGSNTIGSIEIERSELKSIAANASEADNSKIGTVPLDSIEPGNSQSKLFGIYSVEADSSELKPVMIESIARNVSESKSIAVNSLEAGNSKSRPVAVDLIERDNLELKQFAVDSVERDYSESKSIVVNLIETNNSESEAVVVNSIQENKSLSKEVAVDSNKSSQDTTHIFSASEVERESNEIITPNDNDSVTTSHNNGSSIVFHYSSSDEMTERDATTTQKNLETIKFNDGSNFHSPIAFSDETTLDSVKDAEDEETQNLKHLCLTTCAKVVLHKLGPEDYVNLRQPKIKLHRISYEKYAVELRAKRRCIEGKVYLEFDGSSNSNNSCGPNTSSSEDYCPTKVKRKTPIRRHLPPQLRTSESEIDSNNSDDFKLSTIIAKARKRRLSTPSTSQSSTSQHVTGPKSARKSGPKSARRKTGPKSSKQRLIVTPRSASGLKLRISNAEQNLLETGAESKGSRNVVYEEIIQLSSSSSDTYILNDLPVIEEELIEVDHPLFEEEIII